VARRATARPGRAGVAAAAGRTDQACRAEALAGEAWSVADELGWAKTYDANYVALARLLRCRLVTLDARLRRGAARHGFVVGPTEL
jgi:hypothetical protein